MTTIQVTFADAWLTDITDPTVSVHAPFDDRKKVLLKAGEVRTYAGGRRRIITTPGMSQTFPLTLQLLTDAELDQVELWLGRVLLLRDSAGRRVFGTLLSLDVEDYYDAAGTLHDASLMFTNIDFDEEVLSSASLDVYGAVYGSTY